MENKVLEYNLLGGMISQTVMDQISAEASVAAKGAPVTIIIRNIASASIPRFIVDYGDVVHTLVAGLRAREEEIHHLKAEIKV